MERWILFDTTRGTNAQVKSISSGLEAPDDNYIKINNYYEPPVNGAVNIPYYSPLTGDFFWVERYAKDYLSQILLDIADIKKYIVSK